MVGGGDLFYLKFWVKLILLAPVIPSAVTPSEKKFNNTNRKSITSFPACLRWTLYVVPKPPKGLTKKLCYKVSLCEYCHRQSCKAFTIRAIMVRGGGTSCATIFVQTKVLAIIWSLSCSYQCGPEMRSPLFRGIKARHAGCPMLKLAAASAVAIVGHTQLKNLGPLSISDFINTQRIMFTWKVKNAFINIFTWYDTNVERRSYSQSPDCQQLHDLNCGYM